MGRENELFPCNNYNRSFQTIGEFEDHSNKVHKNNTIVCFPYKTHFFTDVDYAKNSKPNNQLGSSYVCYACGLELGPNDPMHNKLK
ncbi:hypothetical protein ACE6H2_020316 [Prunus campanulata]